MKLAVPDMISNSYFPAEAAIELGFFRAQGLDVTLEMIFPVDKAYMALRDGAVDFVGGSAHSALAAFPQWQGVKLICVTGGVKRWINSSKSTKSVPTPVPEIMLFMSLLARDRSRTVVCSSKLTVASSSLIDCISSLDDRRSSLEVSSSSLALLRYSSFSRSSCSNAVISAPALSLSNPSASVVFSRVSSTQEYVEN